MSCKHYNFYQRPFIQSHEINAMPGAGVAAVSVAYCDHNGSPFCRIHAEKSIASNFLVCAGAGLTSTQCQIPADKRN